LLPFDPSCRRLGRSSTQATGQIKRKRSPGCGANAANVPEPIEKECAVRRWRRPAGCLVIPGSKQPSSNVSGRSVAGDAIDRRGRVRRWRAGRLLNDAGTGSGYLLPVNAPWRRRLPLLDWAGCSRLRPWGALQRALEFSGDVGGVSVAPRAVTSPIARWLGFAAIRCCVVRRHARVRAAGGDHRKAGEQDDDRKTTRGMFQDDLSDRHRSTS
jgi:hypothetical protein